MRTFIRACVKLMAVICLAFVPIAAYRVVVELAAGNILGALASLAFAPVGAFLAWALWTNTDGVAEVYMDRGHGSRPDESWRASQEASASARIVEEATTRRADDEVPATTGVDPAALRAHLRVADAAMLNIVGRHPDRPDLRWAAIGAWAAEEAAWVAGLPDGDRRLRLFAGEYAAATSAAQAYAAEMGDAVGRGDTAAVERLTAAGQELDRRFRLLFDLAEGLAWS